MNTSPEIQLPLSEQTFYILLSLVPGPNHGYAILKDIQQLSGGRLSISVSTLYTSLKRLLELDWIERAIPEDRGQGGHDRKAYQLTQIGRRVLSAETRRLQSLVQAANQRLPEESA
jgi:DNA-binding PadR family transcriptional regulator